MLGLYEVIFLQITQAAFHSLSLCHSLLLPLLSSLFSLLWSTFSSFFSPLSYPTSALLEGSSPLIFLLPTTLYVHLIFFKQLKYLKHLILHMVSSVTYFGGSSYPPFPYSIAFVKHIYYSFSLGVQQISLNKSR